MVDGHLAGRRRRGVAAVIRINHVTLPAGLSAVVRRGPRGELHVLVSNALSSERKRAALRVALRASQRAGWRAVLLPMPVAALLPAARARLSETVSALRRHPVTSATVVGLAAVSAVLLVAVLPHHRAPASAGRVPETPRIQAPGPEHVGVGPRSSGGTQSPGHASAAGVPPTSTSPQTSNSPRRAVSPTPTAAPEPSPSPAPARSANPPPGPRSSPSPSPSSGSGCIDLLGIRVCV